LTSGASIYALPAYLKSSIEANNQLGVEWVVSVQSSSFSLLFRAA
jgi:hypothetical protein